MKLILPALILCLFSVGFAGEPSSGNADIGPFVRWLLDDGERLEDVRFAEVAQAVSGCKVLPVDTTNAVDVAMLTYLQVSLDAALLEFARLDNPIHSVGRVNEISRHVEDFLLSRLNAAEGYECMIPVSYTHLRAHET